MAAQTAAAKSETAKSVLPRTELRPLISDKLFEHIKSIGGGVPGHARGLSLSRAAAVVLHAIEA